MLTTLASVTSSVVTHRQRAGDAAARSNMSFYRRALRAMPPMESLPTILAVLGMVATARRMRLATMPAGGRGPEGGCPVTSGRDAPSEGR